MLCEFQYYDPNSIDSNCTNVTDEIDNSTISSFNSSNISAIMLPCQKKILNPSNLEYLITFWVFSFLCQEIFQVYLFVLKNNFFLLFFGKIIS